MRSLTVHTRSRLPVGKVSRQLTLFRTPPGLEVEPARPRVVRITPAIEQARDAALERVAAAAEPERAPDDPPVPPFGVRARARILLELAERGPASGEALVLACRANGVLPRKDDRAFGPVFAGLVRDGLIHQVGECLRARGHGTGGGRIWAKKPLAQ